MNKKRYETFCSNESSMKIYSQPFWLDAVCGEENWDVSLVEKGGQIIASMPYFIKKRALFTYIAMPQLTQTLGPYIKYPPSQKYEKKMAYEKEMLDALFEQLPPFDSYEQSFHYNITNWLPLYWKDFKQTTKYTYLIDDLSNLDYIRSNFNSRKRRNLEKIKETVFITHNLDLEKFYEINKAIFNAQGLDIFYSYELVKKIDDACQKHKCRRICFAVDKYNNLLGAFYAIFDKTSLYVIMGGMHPDFKDSHAGVLLEYTMMEFASKNSLKFDFEGSMIEGIANYNRSLGGVQKPYLEISKVNSSTVKIKRYLQSLFS